jgi:hypothetical protein
MLIGVRLQGDPLVERQAAGAISSPAQYDGVAGHRSFDGRGQGGGLLQRRARGIALSIGRHIVNVRGILGQIISLLDRAIRTAGRLGLPGQQPKQKKKKGVTNPGWLASFP